ncbi:transmembrane protein, putative (macronuclear) [Tetrahymena thermophila SB210]|uniref:Transmembrane protein, putative n=1 Tax=Tetrahymena thermophila (strain SB210) TaxID=312017 RepID=W7XHS0_TETTS|nr:transmembrane protein, putative [Tetrahymena thermophila SB210]EWS74001.1 transmembrane protein, putative [Tetrahymena thermophila SB210]|eukprot:XP_012653463.1 transmembrane protein, putative [Tetrahymena thermophila SB210]
MTQKRNNKAQNQQNQIIYQKLNTYQSDISFRHTYSQQPLYTSIHPFIQINIHPYLPTYINSYKNKSQVLEQFPTSQNYCYQQQPLFLILINKFAIYLQISIQINYFLTINLPY